MALFAGDIVQWKTRRGGQPLGDALNEAHGCDRGTRQRPHGDQVNGPEQLGSGIVMEPRRDQGVLTMQERWRSKVIGEEEHRDLPSTLH